MHQLSNQAALYIHIPWCLQKCPYCDFNSHKSPQVLPEEAYVDALLKDFQCDLGYLPHKEISSVFIGGGTPSMLSGQAYQRLFNNLRQMIPFRQDLEITLEANPGTVLEHRLVGYRDAGINRLSIGVQSFNSEHLRKLGRIHDAQQATSAVLKAQAAGFENINIDIMHGLPGQQVLEGLADLQQAISLGVTHISWYQLTIEANTLFYKNPPILPSEDILGDLEAQGFELLARNGFDRYEISAFCRNQRYSQHNLTYWLYGDYYGIGAGAHGKLTDGEHRIVRTRKQRQPKDYLHPGKKFLALCETVPLKDLPFEFILNTSRLHFPIDYALFKQRSGLDDGAFMARLAVAEDKGLVQCLEESWQVTELGRRFTNDLQELFLPES